LGSSFHCFTRFASLPYFLGLIIRHPVVRNVEWSASILWRGCSRNVHEDSPSRARNSRFHQWRSRRFISQIVGPRSKNQTATTASNQGMFLLLHRMACFSSPVFILIS
jgi:hypothetical protein